MNCQQAKPLLDPYADGELEASAILELERHLRDCPACALALNNLQVLKKTVKSDELYFTAPAELRARLKAALPTPAKPIVRRPLWTWNWLTAGMSGAFAICLALLVLVTQSRSTSGQPLSQEVLAGHIRSLMADHVTDVASTDQHTVKPWFNGKLDFSPPVKDLAAEGFPLIGGRLDYLGGRSVAALVFQRQKHIINLFVWPTKEKDLPAESVASSQGYNLIHRSEAGMTFWAVSDLNRKELITFMQDFAAAAPLREH
jgi:anti-sigma factor RsiW